MQALKVLAPSNEIVEKFEKSQSEDDEILKPSVAVHNKVKSLAVRGLPREVCQLKIDISMRTLRKTEDFRSLSLRKALALMGRVH